MSPPQSKKIQIKKRTAQISMPWFTRLRIEITYNSAVTGLVTA